MDLALPVIFTLTLIDFEFLVHRCKRQERHQLRVGANG